MTQNDSQKIPDGPDKLGLPPLELLDPPEATLPKELEIRTCPQAKALEAVMESFGIAAKVERIYTGPVVTLYELGLAPGIKSSQVAALSKDIARALKSPPIRIIDNIPGKSTMGVEVPNLDRERVRLKELFQLGGDVIGKMNLPMCLGKDAAGYAMIEDLTRMPHLLMAGIGGSGMSMCINSIIMTFLLTQRPDHVKLILIGPKMGEMQDYQSIPHLVAPIIDDISKAERTLEWATHKMDERFEILSEANVRNIRDYNKLPRDEIITKFNATTDDDKAKLVFHMPYIVIIIDELADLMMTSKDVEGHIVRIAQKARAVGIHLILATQRPVDQVVTSLIKSNIPARICLQVRSRLDSRIMLDRAGGELLLGLGDMMMLKPTGGGMIRAQGAFVDDREIKGVCKFFKGTTEPQFDPELMQLGTSGGLAEGEEKDELYNEAVDITIASGRGSVSLIQRRLNIGYSRTCRIIDQLRRTGVVGSYKGSVELEVTLTKEEWESMKSEMGGTSPSIAAGSNPASEGNTGTDSGRPVAPPLSLQTIRLQSGRPACLVRLWAASVPPEALSCSSENVRTASYLKAIRREVTERFGATIPQHWVGPWWVPAREGQRHLPCFYFAGEFMSHQPTGGSAAADGSRLAIVWFQDSMEPLIAPENVRAIEAVQWDQLAANDGAPHDGGR